MVDPPVEFLDSETGPPVSDRLFQSGSSVQGGLSLAVLNVVGPMDPEDDLFLLWMQSMTTREVQGDGEILLLSALSLELGALSQTVHAVRGSV